jgi:hypothetical protein
VEVVPTPEEEISKIRHLEIKPQIELVGKEIGIAEQNIYIYITIVSSVDWDYNTIVGETYV